MAELKAKEGELHMTIEVRRAATGKTETFDLVGKVIRDGGNALDNSARRSD